MHDFNLITALLGALILGLGLISKRLARSSLPPTVLALLVGFALGPHALGLLDIDALVASEARLRERLARLTLGISLVGVALRIPEGFLRRKWRSAMLLVFVSMPLSWALTTGMAYAILDLPFWMAALIGAVLTPTDPVAAAPIVTGPLAERNLPEDLRHTISLESGANDGLAYLLVLLCLLMLTHPPEVALADWLSRILFWEVTGAALLGLLLGYAAGALLDRAERADAIEGDWRLVYTVALALLTVGVGRLIQSDEVLVAFAAGVGFVTAATRRERMEEDHGQEAINRFFAVPIFALVGLTVPLEGWMDLGWRGPALAVAVLLFRRLPVVLLLRPMLPLVRERREALFVGWFGPIAVAALYYGSLMEHRLQEPVVWHVVSLIICASALVHGTTGASFTRAFGARTSGGVG